MSTGKSSPKAKSRTKTIKLERAFKQILHGVKAEEEKVAEARPTPSYFAGYSSKYLRAI